MRRSVGFACAAALALALVPETAFGQGQQEDPAEAEDAPPPPPHGKGGHGARGPDGAALFEPPEDGTVDDPSIPLGTLEIGIVDAEGRPQPGASVTLGILYNSVAKGDSRKRVVQAANDKGVARFEHLDTGSAVAYRPMVIQDGATFEMLPFRLSDKTGMKGILHVYPVVANQSEAMIVSQAILYTEVKDDRIQVQQMFKLFNFGKSAWVPKELMVSLPETFTAFNAQQGMTDITVEAVAKKGVRIRGTFSPGQHMIQFSWQLPYSGEAEVNFEVGASPQMAVARVIAPASKDMKLNVEGFPTPQPMSDGQGQRALITERQFRREEPLLKAFSVSIKGLPTEGPAKIVATGITGCALLFGLVLGAKKPARRDRKTERARLLEELEELERAHAAGDLGPKTYEDARRQLLDAIARTLAEDTPPTKKVRAKAKLA